MKASQAYREFSEAKSETLPLFLNSWWLDAACGEQWGACMVEKGGNVCAVMPYSIRSGRLGLTHIGQPPLTQYLGPWISPTNAKYAKRISREKELMGKLIEQLPKYASFSQNWHYSVNNWLPFYWKGFAQTTGYTYVLDDLSDLELVYSGFQEKVKTDIKKAKDRYGLRVSDELPIDDFLTLNAMTFRRQGKDVPYTDDYVKRLIDAAVLRKRCKWFVSLDDEGNKHAGVLIVWDDVAAYYLMGGGNPSLRNSGATSLCLWEAIRFAASCGLKFDFEGSMIEPVERFVRGFGARQKPYFSISHTPSRLISVVRGVRAVL